MQREIVRRFTINKLIFIVGLVYSAFALIGFYALFELHSFTNKTVSMYIGQEIAGSSIIFLNITSLVLVTSIVLMMIIALILVHIGSVKTKKAGTSAKKFKVAAIWYGIALILIIAGIPWDRALM